MDVNCYDTVVLNEIYKSELKIQWSSNKSQNPQLEK